MADTDTAQFDQFLAHTRVRLARAFIVAFGSDRGEDALAEAIAYAWANFDRLSEMQNPVAYLFRVGQSRTRAQRRRTLFPPAEHGGIPDIEPGLVSALNSLSVRQRTCTLLVHAYDWSQVEVAELLGISASSVHRHIERGMRALRHRIGSIDD